MGMFNISTYRKHQLKQPRRFAVIRKTDIVYIQQTFPFKRLEFVPL